MKRNLKRLTAFLICFAMCFSTFAQAVALDFYSDPANIPNIDVVPDASSDDRLDIVESALPDSEYAIDSNDEPSLPDSEPAIDSNDELSLPDGEHAIDSNDELKFPDGEHAIDSNDEPSLPDDEHAIDSNDENENLDDTENYIVVYKNADDLYLRGSMSAYSVVDAPTPLLYDVIEMTEEDAKALTMSNDVAYIEKDYTACICDDITVDTEEYSAEAQAVAASSQSSGWGYNHINASLIPKEYRGHGVKVAVLDSGISPHNDIKIAGGVSFVDYTDSYYDDNGHGTHVAGIIAALDNNIGIIGVAPDAEIYAVKVLDSKGDGPYSAIIKGIQWAIDNDMDIINMSLGGKEVSNALESAVNLAAKAGIIVIAAAGNDGPSYGTVRYPAKYDSVVAVSAIDTYKNAAAFSSRGAEVNIAAPGTLIQSLLNASSAYIARSGTSQAAPYVSGTAAALLSKNPSVSADEIITCLYETASPASSSDAALFGHGIVNAAAALDILNLPQNPAGGENNLNSLPDSIAYDIRLNQYKEKLRIYRDQAIASGQIELSKEISQSLDALIQNDMIIRGLCSEEQNIIASKNSQSSGLSEQNLIDALYAEKADSLNALEDYCRQTVDVFQGRFNSISGSPPGSLSQASPQRIYENSPLDISSSGQRIFKFIPNQSGMHIISTNYYNNGSVNNDTYIELFDNAELNPSDRIACSDDSHGSLFSSIEKYLTSGKEYYILLKNYSEGAAIFARLSVTRSIPEIDSGQYFDISLGSGEYTVYSFSPQQTAMYTVKTSKFDMTGQSNDTILEIYSDAALKNIIARNDDNTADGFSLIKRQFAAGTSYYIKLYHFDSAHGKVHARLSLSNSAADSISKISLGETAAVQLDKHSASVLRFIPSQTAVYKISASPLGNSDSYLELFLDSALTKRAAANDDTDGSYGSKINYQLEKDLKYYIRISGYGGQAVSADISIQRAAAPAERIYLNSAISASVSAGGYALYKYIPVQSGIHTIKTLSSGGSANDTVIKIYAVAENASQIASDDDGGDGTLSMATLHLSAGTTYYIMFSGYNGSAAKANITITK